MSFEVSIHIDDKAVKKRLKDVQTDLKQFTIPLQRSRDIVLKNTDKQWSTQGRHLGTPWPPRKKIVPWKILDKTGRMRRGFSWSPFRPKQEIEITNKVEYFKYHQSAEPRKKIPRRQMLALPQSLKDKIVKEFEKHILSVVNK